MLSVLTPTSQKTSLAAPSRVWRLSALLVLLCGTSRTLFAQAQQQGVYRGPAVEIRGTAPMPQVVTIRPREVPQYLLRLPAQKEFTKGIAKPYSIVSTRLAFGGVLDALTPRADSVGAPQLFAFPVPAIRPLELPPLDGKMSQYASWCTPSWWCPQGTTATASLSPYVPADFPRR